jgi:hypothetical protein
MSSKNKNIFLRLLVGIGVPVCMVAVALLFMAIKGSPPCIFYQLTGLYCPGCGAGRCFLALMRLEIYQAFRFQPLLFIFLPVIAYYLLKVYIKFVFGKDVLPFPEIKSKLVAISIPTIIIAYWVLRNIPIFPFTLLAPNVV